MRESTRIKLEEGDRLRWSCPDEDSDPDSDGTVLSNENGYVRIRWDDGVEACIHAADPRAKPFWKNVSKL